MSEPPAACLLETARAWLPLALSAAAAIFLGRFLTRYVKHVKDLIRLLHVDAPLHWLRKKSRKKGTMYDGDLQILVLGRLMYVPNTGYATKMFISSFVRLEKGKSVSINRHEPLAFIRTLRVATPTTLSSAAAPANRRYVQGGLGRLLPVCSLDHSLDAGAGLRTKVAHVFEF